MGIMIDAIYDTMQKVADGHTSILNGSFMMSIFIAIWELILPFDEFLTWKFNSQQTSVVGDRSTRVQEFRMLHNELFFPTRKENIETKSLVEELGVIAAKAIVKELCDTKKETSQYLSSINGPYSWKNTPPNIQKALLGKNATNDNSERCHGAGSRQLQVFTTVSTQGAFGMG